MKKQKRKKKKVAEILFFVFAVVSLLAFFTPLQVIDHLTANSPMHITVACKSKHGQAAVSGRGSWDHLADAVLYRMQAIEWDTEVVVFFQILEKHKCTESLRKSASKNNLKLLPLSPRRCGYKIPFFKMQLNREM